MNRIELKNKRLDFLNETVNYYNLGNRGVNEDGNCRYSKKCAIGRHISKELCEKFDAQECNVVGCEYVFNFLTDFLKELGATFLAEIQMLHDYSDFWNPKGLSLRGYDEVLRIKERFCLV